MEILAQIIPRCGIQYFATLSLVAIHTIMKTNITMENHSFYWVNKLEMARFNSYVKLPKGTSYIIVLHSIEIEIIETY